MKQLFHKKKLREKQNHSYTMNGKSIPVNTINACCTRITKNDLTQFNQLLKITEEQGTTGYFNIKVYFYFSDFS